MKFLSILLFGLFLVTSGVVHGQATEETIEDVGNKNFISKIFKKRTEEEKQTRKKIRQEKRKERKTKRKTFIKDKTEKVKKFASKVFNKRTEEEKQTRKNIRQEKRKERKTKRKAFIKDKTEKVKKFASKVFNKRTEEEKQTRKKIRQEKRKERKAKRKSFISDKVTKIKKFFSKIFKQKTDEEKQKRKIVRKEKREKRKVKRKTFFLKKSTSVKKFFSSVFKGKTPEEKRASRIKREKKKELRRKELIDIKNRNCSLAHSYKPNCWQEREKAELKIALVYYGDDSMSMDDLNRLEPLLKERFFKATDYSLSVNIIAKRVIPFKQRMPKDYRYGSVTDPKRLQRIWYHDNVGGKIIEEIYSEFKKIENIDTFHKLDAVLTITSGQFNALGFASGRMSVTEYPTEVGFADISGGRVDYASDYILVDELIHELGHNLFLGHTTTHCMTHLIMKEMGEDEITQEVIDESNRCCDASPSKDDVMSYCRNRSSVSKDKMHGFESCSLSIIKDKIIPNILSGGVWNTPDRPKCM